MTMMSSPRSSNNRPSCRSGRSKHSGRRNRVRPWSPSKLASFLRGDYDEDYDWPPMTVECTDEGERLEKTAREPLRRAQSLPIDDDGFSDSSSDSTGGCCGPTVEKNISTSGGDNDRAILDWRMKRAASCLALGLAAVSTANFGGGASGGKGGWSSDGLAVAGVAQPMEAMEAAAGWGRSLNVLVTGGAGFIGMHAAMSLRDLGHNPIAYDNLSPIPYSPAIKSARINHLLQHSIPFTQGDVCDADTLNRTLTDRSIDAVVHLASQSYERVDGMVKRPFRYPADNLDCFAALLDQLRARSSNGRGGGTSSIKLVYASSTDAFRLSLTVPHSPAKDEVLDPNPKHAGTFRSNEMIARAYYRLYGVSSVGVRFGTVYGPWGRPDMGYYAVATQLVQNRNEARSHHKAGKGRSEIETKAGGKAETDTKAVGEAEAEAEAKKVERGFVYVDNVVHGLLSMLAVPNDGADVVTLRRPCATSDETVLQLLEREILGEGDFQGNISVAPSSPSPSLRQSQLHDDGSSGGSGGGGSGGGGGLTDREELLRAARHGLPSALDLVPLEEGMRRFIRWFREEDGAKYAPPLTAPNAETLETKQGASASNVSASTEHDAVTSKLCFITSMFSDDPAMQSNEVFSVEEYNHAHPFEYYYFTNVKGLEAPGWEVVLIEDLPYKRFITQSRFPKFMGWSHPKLSSCRTIYYSDSNRPPKSLPLTNWTALSVAAAAAKSGVLQDVRPGHEPLLDELASLIPRRKDIKRNVETSREWFLSQPDFNNNATAWWNMASVIDPANQNYRELTTTFWAHYSAEEGSWRDQPLWRHMVDKLGIVPSGFPGVRRGHDVYWDKIRGSGKSHHYDEGDDEKRNLTVGEVANESKP